MPSEAGYVTGQRDLILDDVLHWVWSWQLQVHRLSLSTLGEGQGRDELDRRKSSSAASLDEHLLLVVGTNLSRALIEASKVHPPLTFPRELLDPLVLLRNIYEHWEEQRPTFRNRVDLHRSGREFAASFPDGQPWSIKYDGGEWRIGGVAAINEITTLLAGVEMEVLGQRQRAGGRE